MTDPAKDDAEWRASDQTFTDYRNYILREGRAFPKRLQQIAAFTLSYPDEVAFGNIGDVATRIGVHHSALVRFAQRIGYSGFVEFQAIFQQRVKSRASAYEDRVTSVLASDEAEDGSIVLEGSRAAARQSIETLAERIAPGALDEVAGLLARAETIHLVAQRRAFPVVAYLNYVLTQLGIRNDILASPVGIEEERIRFASPRDVALAVSFSPYSAVTLERVKLLAARGVPVVAITDSSFSPLVPVSTHWLEIIEGSYAGFRSLAASMTLVQALAIAAAEERRLVSPHP